MFFLFPFLIPKIPLELWVLKFEQLLGLSGVLVTRKLVKERSKAAHMGLNTTLLKCIDHVFHRSNAKEDIKNDEKKRQASLL